MVLLEREGYRQQITLSELSELLPHGAVAADREQVLIFLLERNSGRIRDRNMYTDRIDIA